MNIYVEFSATDEGSTLTLQHCIPFLVVNPEGGFFLRCRNRKELQLDAATLKQLAQQALASVKEWQNQEGFDGYPL